MYITYNYMIYIYTYICTLFCGNISGWNVTVKEVIVLKVCVPQFRKDEKHAKWINAILCTFATYIFKLQWLISLERSEVSNKKLCDSSKRDILNFAVETNCACLSLHFQLSLGGDGVESGKSVTLRPETADVWAGRRVGSQARQQHELHLGSVLWSHLV